jgi:hypothetical protein
VNTRQLNRPFTDHDMKTGNLLQTWNRLELFQPAIREADLSKLDRLVALTDTKAKLEFRVRSYLDANCAQCHRPGGTRGDFDARFETPLDRQKLLNAPLLSSDLGIPGVKMVVPGDPERSMIHLRLKRRQDVFNMPPLASHEADPEAVAIVREWIQGLVSDKPAPKPSTQPPPPPGLSRWGDDWPARMSVAPARTSATTGLVPLVVSLGFTSESSSVVIPCTTREIRREDSHVHGQEPGCGAERDAPSGPSALRTYSHP